MAPDGAGTAGGTQLPFTQVHITPGDEPGQEGDVGAEYNSGESGGSQLPSWQIHPAPGADPGQPVEGAGAGAGSGAVVPPPAAGESGGTQPPLMQTQPATGAGPIHPPELDPEPGMVVETSLEGALLVPAVL